MSFNTPIVLFIYNRPTFFSNLIDVLRGVKPKYLYIVADGFKDKTDELKCDKTRAIINKIDWNTNIKTKFSAINLGCTQNIVGGLDWVFKHENKAIILEDDCLPDLTFFRFCEDLLTFYNDDEKIMHISGCNILSHKKTCSNSYFFSNFVLPPWGWATWAKSWQKFNKELNSWQQHKQEIHHHISQKNFAKWTDTFEEIRKNKITWDIPWNVDLWVNKGIGITPAVNLVYNQGFGEEATFTKNKNSKFAHLQRGKMMFPLIHPQKKYLTAFDKEVEDACIFLLNDML